MSNTELIDQLVHSNKYAPLNESEQIVMKHLLENAEKENNKIISEGTLAGDVAQFTPILMPMVRRVYPQLIANQLLGIQPMTMPTGYIYALVNQYVGTGVNRITPNIKGVIVKTVAASGVKAGDTVFTDGKVVYVENLFVLVQVGSTAPAVGATIGSSKVAELYTNEAAFAHILKNYTGPYVTADAEKLGSDMSEIGLSVTKKSVEAKSRALKGRYTVEMYQDLKSQHGLLADEELMTLMSYEMQAELDREVVDFVNGNATQLPDTTFAYKTETGAIPDGRWEIERYRAQAIRISKEATKIGIDTKRGSGNILLVSPMVATMLEQLGGFSAAPQANTVSQPVSGGIAGVYDNRYNVIVDQYATTDYITVLYKGASNRDGMGFFCPYIPLSFTKVTEYESAQPAIIAKLRYALTTVPGVESADSTDRAKAYARSWGVDFANTVLA